MKNKHISIQKYKSKSVDVLPVLMFRASGWPFQESLAKAIDKVQIRMIAILQPVPRLTTEPDAEYHRRRCRMAGTLAHRQGLWSTVWAKRVVSWHGHVERNHIKTMWSKNLMAFHDERWLQSQRSLYAPSSSAALRPWTVFGGRTSTRSKRGAPPPRWQPRARDGSI